MNNKIEFTVEGSKGRFYQTYFMLDKNNKLDYSHCNCMSYKMKRKCKHIDSLLNNDKKIKILDGDLSQLSLIKSESSELAHNEVILWENEITKIEKKLSEAKIELMKAKDIYYRLLNDH